MPGMQEVQDIWAAARRQRRLAHKTFEAADYEMYDSKVGGVGPQPRFNLSTVIYALLLVVPELLRVDICFASTEGECKRVARREGRTETRMNSLGALLRSC